jgi:hypothetical protein
MRLPASRCQPTLNACFVVLCLPTDGNCRFGSSDFGTLVFPGLDHSFIGKTPETRDANLLKALVATFGFFFDKTLQPPSGAKSGAKVKLHAGVWPCP